MSRRRDSIHMLSTRTALWRDRLLRFAMGGGVMVVGAAFGAVRNKWLAEHLSTAGLGVLAQIISAQTWLGTVAGLGLSLPVAGAVAAGIGAGDSPSVRRTAWTALTLAGTAALVVVGCCLLFAPSVSTLLLGTDAHALLIRISMVGVAALALHVVVSGLFYGRSDVRAPLIVSFAGGIVAVATTMALVPAAGLTGGAIGVAVLVPAGLAAALWSRRAVHRESLFPIPSPRFDPAVARALLRVGLAALVLAVLDLGIPLVLRAHYLRVHGLSANGLLQAAMALAQQGSSVFIAYLTAYAFGRISGRQGTQGIRDYTRRHWGPLVGLAAAAFALAMLLATPLILLFYSDRFTPARPLMAWTLFAEFCRVMTQVWSLGALPLGALRTWVAIGVSGPAALAAGYALLGPSQGAMSLPYAAALASLTQLVVAGLLMGRRGITLRLGDVGLVVASLAGLAWLASLVAR